MDFDLAVSAREHVHESVLQFFERRMRSDFLLDVHMPRYHAPDAETLEE